MRASQSGALRALPSVCIHSLHLGGCVVSKPERPSVQNGLLKAIQGALLLTPLVFSAPSPAAPANGSEQPQAASDPRDDRSPWGVASGAEWFSVYPLFNPMLKQAGVRWLRGFYEWQTLQPKQGTWNFVLPDRLVE